MHRLLAACLFTSALVAASCSSPGGDTTFVPGQDTASDAVFFPDSAPLFDSDSGAPADTAPAPDTVAPTDTAGPVDTAPPIDTAVPADTEGPACVSGSACNDFDPCTVNDQCVAGVCRGGAVDCSDDIPCTLDTCLGGQCRHEMQPGFCLIGGACWSHQQYNPTNDCQKCVSTADTNGWTNDDGRKCEDGDACTTGEVCSAGACGGGVPPREVCDDNVDNDCNGATDAEDSACGTVVAGCNYHEDCYPARVCARWVSTGEAVCSEPCLGEQDCEAGQICSKLPGSAQIGFCQAPIDGGLPNGSACSVDSECASFLCAEDVCRSTCLVEDRCTAPGYTCHPVGDLGVGVISGACAPNPPGTFANGQVCQVNGVFDSQFCASGHCDLMPYPASEVLPCRELCHSESACAPAQECNVVIYAPGENSAAMPFATVYTVLSHDAVTACYTPAHTTGSLTVGSACNQLNKWQCSSNKCFPLSPTDPQAYCTSFCEFDQECPSGMICKPDLVNLASDWVQNPLVGQGASAAYTLVRICKWE